MALRLHAINVAHAHVKRSLAFDSRTPLRVIVLCTECFISEVTLKVDVGHILDEIIVRTVGRHSARAVGPRLHEKPGLKRGGHEIGVQILPE